MGENRDEYQQVMIMYSPVLGNFLHLQAAIRSYQTPNTLDQTSAEEKINVKLSTHRLWPSINKIFSPGFSSTQIPFCIHAEP